MSDTGLPLAASQTRAVQSIEVVTTMRPFLLKCAVLMSLSCVSGAPTCRPVWMSQIRAERSMEAVRTVFPSGLNSA